MIKHLFFFLTVCILLSCLEPPNNFEKLPPGPWRVVLKLTDPDQINSTSEVAEVEGMPDYFKLPFNLDVVYDDNREMEVYIINGEERIKVEEVNYGRDPRTAKDTLQLNLKTFDSTLDGFYEDNIIEGYWKVPYRGEDYRIKFIAYYGQKHRFDLPQTKSTYNFDGKWKVTFEHDNKDAYPAIAEFKQEGKILNGTFLTETGDYRYLSGNAYGNKMKLSVFDGAHAFLFSGNVSNDTIYGEFRSGKHYKSNWMAVRDDEFTLTNPSDMTKAVDEKPIAFAFPNSEGSQTDINDPKYKSKYKLINIMGTWCPNCRDEINFLKEVQAKHPNIEIISIAFEKYRDTEKAMTILKKYKSQMNFDWPILLGGYANKKETGETFEFLDKIYSYPTLLLVDDNNKIIDIHTGFNGPATSEYQAFKKDYYSKLAGLNI